MANFIIGLVIGIFAGGLLGFMIAALMVGAHSADEHIRALRGE